MKLGLYDKTTGVLIDTIPDGEVSGYMLDQYFILKSEKPKAKIKVGVTKKSVTYKDMDEKDVTTDVDVPTVDGVEYSPMMGS